MNLFVQARLEFGNGYGFQNSLHDSQWVDNSWFACDVIAAMLMYNNNIVAITSFVVAATPFVI